MRASEECWFGSNAPARSLSERVSSSKRKGPVKLILSPSKHHCYNSVNQFAKFCNKARSLGTQLTEPVTPRIVFSTSDTIDSDTMTGEQDANSNDDNGRRNARALSKKRRFMNAEKLGTFASPPSNERRTKSYRQDQHFGFSSKSEDSKRPQSRGSESGSEDESKNVPSTIDVPGSGELQQEELSQIDNLSHAQAEDGDYLDKRGGQAPEASEFSLLFQGQSSVQRERAMRLLDWNCSARRTESEGLEQSSSAHSTSGGESFSHLFGNEPELEKKAESLLTWEYKAPKPPKPIIFKPPASLKRPRDIRPVSPDHSARTDAIKQLDAAKTLMNLPHLDKKERRHLNSMSPPPVRPHIHRHSPFAGRSAAAVGHSSQLEMPPHVFNAMTRMHLSSLQRQTQMPSPLLLDAYFRLSNRHR